ncbi:uncharacterized protein A1O5_06859 [Cladophialophora psammophila CBS 110553]|uniref:Uncharacterized protein n=1 Tax=Cladophialophora psammophila CBS 110553 TaxID=1182543 RepID=W9WPF2_9EURO|nr:uncharacterized protein A1O5_06859 [Cladophialophora psammophila CBS 110553]EXJ69788.1 hypothetical protein A1O5_06859 [Cladophialophora psammophila CBS 110553]
MGARLENRLFVYVLHFAQSSDDALRARELTVCPLTGPAAHNVMLQAFSVHGLNKEKGPAKGYIEGLEHRLHEAESLLLALLPIISTEQLKCATDSLSSSPSTTNLNILGLKTRDSPSPGPHAMRSSPPVLNKKTGIEYWESFPLDTVENIRKWQEDCALHSGTNGQAQSSFRNSIDESHSHNPLHALNAASHSRPGSVDLSRHGHGHSQSGPFRSMSHDTYRSGASTPVNVPQHSLSQPTIPTTSSTQQQHTGPSQTSTPNWQSLSSFLSNNSSPNNNTSSPNVNGVGIGAEAMLLQSFADSSWAQAQTLNNGLGMTGMGTAMGMESGPMEVDTGFFTNDMQRRLFW